MALEDHSAPGSAAGFIFQFERALYWLAKSPSGCRVGIETCDDVVFEDESGLLSLEQDKSSILPNAQPFGNRSKDLWNTLQIWMRALVADEINLDSTRFWMITNKSIGDCIAKSISNASDKDSIAKCIDELTKAAENPPQAIENFVSPVLDENNRPFLEGLIANCKLADSGDGSSGEQLRKQTIAELRLPDWAADSADGILNELRGWFDQTVLSHWHAQQSAWVNQNQFSNQLHAILQSRNRKLLRERASHLIEVVDEEVGSKKGSQFVKQIHLICDDDGIVDDAIREFVRCNIEKARLSADGNITDQDWLSFQSSLEERWGKISKSQVRLKGNASEEDVGFKIFKETTESYCARLAGIETEQVYLTSGTYHRMADNLTVGWHPRYINLMKEQNDD